MNGGSNYVVVGDNRLAVIKFFHLDPGAVGADLRAMFNAGQTKVTFVLWYCRGAGEAGIAIPSDGGRLSDVHAQNLQSLFAMATQIGFSEIVLRFATEWYSAPEEWTSWDQGMFTENAYFIAHALSLVTPTYCDLGLELAGDYRGSQVRDYVTQMYQRFMSMPFPVTFSASTGFQAKGHMIAFVKSLKNAGCPPPALYLVDVYGNEFNKLKAVRDGLAAVRQSGKPVVVQECYYNDKNAALAIKRTKKELKLKIPTVYQWPLPRGQSDNFSNYVTPPVQFNQYKNV